MCGWLWSKIFFKDDANHLLNSPRKNYVISTDWEGCNYLGLTIDRNYSKEYVEISMPDYVRKSMDRFQHPKLKRPQYAPHCWSVPAYGKRPQMVLDPDKSYLLEKNATKRIRSILGTMIYYAWSVDKTMLRAINEILRVQSRPTRDTAKKRKCY